jgi:hypothetical protein
LGLQANPELDRKVYDAGVALESVRTEQGSVAFMVFEKLSSSQGTSYGPPDTRPMLKATAEVL